jgi:beta-galactosidase/beta-glucuronidase
MGNAVGNLIDYWEAIESTNFFMGGAIWDWIDQAMYYYDKKNRRPAFWLMAVILGTSQMTVHSSTMD